MIIRPTLYMSPDYYEKAPIRVTKGNLGVVTQFYQHEVKSFVANKQASIITISMKVPFPKSGRCHQYADRGLRKDAMTTNGGSQKARDNSSTIGWRSSPKN